MNRRLLKHVYKMNVQMAFRVIFNKVKAPFIGIVFRYGGISLYI